MSRDAARLRRTRAGRALRAGWGVGTGAPPPRPSMLRLLPALLLVAGCGTVVPYSLAPDWVAPEIVSGADTSAVVVTGETAAPGRTVVDGRVLDEATGQPVAGVTVAGGAAEVVTDADGRFSLAVAPGGVTLAVTPDGYRPARTALRLAPDTRVGVLVLLSPVPTPDA